MKIKWLIYPLLVLVFIGVSSGTVFDAKQWESVADNQKKIEEDQARIAFLRKKLAVLAAVDADIVEADLKYLYSAVPPTKLVWYLVTQAKAAAAGADIKISEFSAEVGRGVSEAAASSAAAPATGSAVTRVAVGKNALTLEVKLEVDEPAALQRMFAGLEQKLPLVRVNKIEYDKERSEATIELEGAWGAVKAASGSGDLPDYVTSVNEAKSQLSGFTAEPEINVESIPFSPQVDPFRP